MPSWSEILGQLNSQKEEQDGKVIIPYDGVRRSYLKELSDYTGRNTILYATKWTQPSPNADPANISINEEDIQGLMAVIHGLESRGLDIILHSPGGSAEATAAMVSYLRSKFNDIRVIIPHAAMSAATMLACASNKIMMGKHSFLGPTDPQMILFSNGNSRAVPAQALMDEFEKAKTECADPSKLSAWLPILQQYAPGILIQCEEHLDLSKKLVCSWLSEYMFSEIPDRPEAIQKAQNVANNLSDHTKFKSHSYHIDRNEAEEIGLIIEYLESDQRLQDLVLSIYHSTTHTFSGTTAVKIIENQNGRSFVKQVGIKPIKIAPNPAE
ncbi:serine protease [Methanomicrobiaceae archaeon CYW5]|uniref:SDH family Clp fold serine proteinase n=1 Tax=Methanovulcanius yangii TaxID=1789227 RepID=UPI0029CA1225|nr:serine protease [Methanovulcanius yangii]MBT8508271.1 serine protease [Methanovulcanius yangii]